MRQFYFYLISLSLVLVNYQSLRAQGIDTTAFNPTDREALYKEIEAVLTEFKRDDCEKTLDDLKKAIKERRITEEHYEGFIALTNVMVSYKMKRHNFIRPLLETILSFSLDNGLSTQYFDKWIKISIQILSDQQKGKTQAFEKYLAFSYEFWTNGNLYKVSAGSHAWKADSKNFNITYEDSELKIKYENTNLYCFNKQDSLTINNAKGVYYPLREHGVWEGESGRVEWQQDGARDARCDIKNFTISARESSYKTSNAILSYPTVFKIQLEGTFSDRISRRSEVYKKKDPKTGEITEILRTPSNLSYPRFESKSRDIKIDDIGEGVSYQGGFRLEGSVVRGYGDLNGRSTIYITNSEGKVVAKADATDFDIFKGERVISSDAEVSLYFDSENGIDSIYHPNIRIIYNIQSRTIELSRGSSKASRVPFFNSLQQSEMNASYIKWKIDTDQINIGNNDENLNLSSNKFFDVDTYEKYTLTSSINPLVKFAMYSEKLAESREQIANGECDGGGSANGTGEDFSMEKFCKENPNQCPDWFLEEKARKAANKDNPENTEPEPEEEFLPKFDPKRIYVGDILRLLDRRMEKINIMSCAEIAKFRQNPSYKVIVDYADWKDFERNFPKKYKFAAIDANNVVSFTNQIMGPSHDISNGWTLISDLIADGFVVFDYKDSSVVLRDKIFHYKQSVNKKDMVHDFDRIKIKSVPSSKQKRESNAVLDIKKQEMETGGVQSFVLSDSQNVWAEPFSQKVTMKKNRDMVFDGILTAGMLKFTGQQFNFLYDEFQVVMDSINYIDFFIYERKQLTESESSIYAGFYTEEQALDVSGNPSKVTVPIANQFRSTNGVVFIDVSNNKSGRKESNEELPSFESLDTAYVFFDRYNRMGDGVYPQENFYYKVYPFILNSLDKYDPVKLKFRGEFHSADIFPVVDEPLKVMFLDLSFGFETETRGKKGYPVYLRENPDKGKGVYTGLFGISNQGLIGKGRLDYLGAKIESDYVEFMPELFKTDRVDSFSLKEDLIDGVEFPKVQGQSVKIEWAPYSDSMYIESDMEEDVPFQFFQSGEYALKGSLNLTPNGLLGRGEFDWSGATMSSNPGGDFEFGRNSVKSLSTAVTIKSQGVQGFAFENNNVEAVVDFDKRRGDFISNEKDLSTDLPHNSYKTSLDRFYWDMDNQHIFIESTQGKSGFFLATEESQDSLFFLGEKADFDLNTGLLVVDGVDFIRVADAFVYPKDRRVEIEESSHMRTLVDSRIVADTANQNHQILRASINILSKREYKADGFLEFNVDGYKDQEIKFDNIQVAQDGKKYVTKGAGAVAEQDSFYLDSRTRFKGEVNLSADSKNLTFKGFAKLASSVIPYPSWFGIDTKIDKKDVSIAYNVPQNPDGESLYVGLFLGMDSLYLYPTILAPKQGEKDRSVFSAKGVLKYDKNKNTYMFGDSAKVLGGSETGKLFTVSETNAKVTAEGRFDFSNGFNREGLPAFGVDCIGDFDFFLNKTSDYRFEMATSLNFILPQPLAQIIIEDLQANEETIEPILYTSVRNKKLKSQLKEFIPDSKKFDKVWKKIEDDNRLILPEDFAHSFFFSNMVLKWSDKTQSFVTQGNMQLASLNATHVGQILKGALEIQMDPVRGDVLNFYITSPNGDWYYFSYTSGLMMTASSSPSYNNAITSMKKKDARIKTANGATYEIVISNSAAYSQFRQRAQAAF